MTQKADLGKSGEDSACRYLVDKGYKIIERNFRKPWGELDIIAKSPEKILVFVEVKTVQHDSPQAIRQFGNEFGNGFGDAGLPDSGIEPEMQMTAAKIKKIKRAATLYAGHYPELIDDNKGWRIDLLALTLQDTSGSTLSKSNGLTTNEKDCVIKHYENI